MEKKKKERNPVLELVKFLAICEIVCFHAKAPWSQYIYVLPIFMILSISFVANSTSPISIQLKKSFKRFLMPWIFWSAFYAVLKIIQALIGGYSIQDEFNWSMLIAGTAIPLWYLPYAFISLNLVFFIIKHFNFKLNTKNSHLIAIFGGIVLLISSFFFPIVKENYPFGEWLYLLPAIPIGMLFSSFYYKFLKLQFNYGVWIVIIISIIAIYFDRRVGSAHLFASCLCSFVFSLEPPKANSFIYYLGKISYGIYLIHSLWIAILLYLGIKLSSYELVILSLISSILSVAAIRKIPVIKNFV